MTRADLHTHSNISHDGHASMSEMCAAAIRSGLSHICITDHYDCLTDSAGHPLFNDKDYSEQLIVAKKDHSDYIKVLGGIEIGSYHRHPEHMAIVQALSFDMIIGSIHDFGPIFLGDPELREKHSAGEIFTAYFSEVLELVRFGGFDTIGHLDFPARYIRTQSAFNPLVETILREALAKEIIIEINTSPLRKGMDFTMPAESILALYRDCGGRFVTCGSDAHRTGDVAADLDSALRLVQKFGLRPVYFEKRKMRLL